MIEDVSPANKDRAENVEGFAAKAVSALHCGVHLLLIDLFPPGRHDPRGMHGAILDYLSAPDESYNFPIDEPMTLIAYAAGPPIEAFFEHVAVGAALPDMPLFLPRDRYVPVPIEASYQLAYHKMPEHWRDVLERTA